MPPRLSLPEVLSCTLQTELLVLFRPEPVPETSALGPSMACTHSLVYREATGL